MSLAPRSFVRCLLFGFAVAMPLVSTVRADVVLDWNEVLLDAVRVDRTNPPRASRAMAMVHVAIFNAINTIDPKFEPYGEFSFPASPLASKTIAASQAARDVLVALFPGQTSTFDAFLTGWLASVPSGAARTEGIAVGQAAGLHILAVRTNDGADTVVAYTPGTDPGDWQPTPPANAAALLPNWPDVKPFCMTSGAEFRRNGPPPLTSAEFTVNFNETKSLGSATSTTRTTDQTTVARFWADGGGTATPPGHAFQIAQDIAVEEGNTTEENARLFALIGLAVADAGICSWDNKYAYNDWRPITAIRAADTDGNPDTEADPTWTPLIPTPPFPTYTSGHSTFSGASMKILELFYGTDNISFSTTSDDFPGVTRSFTSFSAAADEAGRSRVYGGIHWEYDNQDALGSGRELGVRIFDNFLMPLDESVVEVPADSITRCGNIGFFPFVVLMATFVGLRRRPACRMRRSR